MLSIIHALAGHGYITYVGISVWFLFVVFGMFAAWAVWLDARGHVLDMDIKNEPDRFAKVLGYALAWAIFGFLEIIGTFLGSVLGGAAAYVFLDFGPGYGALVTIALVAAVIYLFKEWMKSGDCDRCDNHN